MLLGRSSLPRIPARDPSTHPHSPRPLVGCRTGSRLTHLVGVYREVQL